MTRSLNQMTVASIASQLVPPPPPRLAVARPRLLERLDTARSSRLATVVAGPGYGKTTLLASWVDRGSVWYTASAADRNPFGLARGLLGALRLRLPGLPASVIGATTLALGPYARPDRETQADAMAEVIAGELASRLRDHLVLVVDAAHELVADPPTLRLLEGLCRNAPPKLHLVLGSSCCGRVRTRRAAPAGCRWRCRRCAPCWTRCTCTTPIMSCAQTGLRSGPGPSVCTSTSRSSSAPPHVASPPTGLVRPNPLGWR